MTMAELLTQYLEHLFSGKRAEARQILLAAQDRGIDAAKLLKTVIWPAMEQIEKLYRANEISLLSEHTATRINRMVADQLQGYLRREPRHGRRIIVTCGDGEIEELGAQITADLFEAAGWSVWFLGSGVPNDEILEFAGKVRPDVLCIYGQDAVGVPNIRRLIDLIREVGVCEEMQILTVGGVFTRAEGLADEVRADLYARNVQDAIRTVEDHPVRIPKPDMPQPGRRRKRKRMARTPLPQMRKSRSTVQA
jgi:methanogenic corrinoid protein MtbC1